MINDSDAYNRFKKLPPDARAKIMVQAFNKEGDDLFQAQAKKEIVKSDRKEKYVDVIKRVVKEFDDLSPDDQKKIVLSIWGEEQMKLFAQVFQKEVPSLGNIEDDALKQIKKSGMLQDLEVFDKLRAAIEQYKIELVRKEMR